MASRPASRQRKAAPAVSKATNSPSSSTTSSSRLVPEASLDGLSSPVSSSALSKPQYLYEDGLGSDAGGSKENVTVTVRFRPLSPREIRQGEEIAWYADGDTIVRSEHNPSVAYAYDRVFGPTTTTRHVYDVAAQHVVSGAMEGINEDNIVLIEPSWSQVVNDLLNPAGQNLRIREDLQGTFVEGIKEEVVLSPAHALSLIAAGEVYYLCLLYLANDDNFDLVTEHRHVGSNNFNLLSSRSHTIFTLNLIDLAGSESSRAETTGVRRKEGSYINKSLLTLGTVIAKLTDGKATHIPYRDSKLTRLLQSSLSGQGRVSLICTVTPSSSNAEETHNTLKFAHRAKHIEIQASQNKIIDEKSLIKKYQNEIRSLKEELEQLKRGIVTVAPLKDMGEDDIVLLKQKLAYLPYRRREMILDTENGDFFVPLEGYGETIDDASKEEKKNRKHGLLNWFKLRTSIKTIDHVDLLREQLKILSGEVALHSSVLKRLSDEANNNPKNEQIQMEIRKISDEIKAKNQHIASLEQQMADSISANQNKMDKLGLSPSYAELVEQLNEKSFELEVKTADNRVIQDQLQQKICECEELRETIASLKQQVASSTSCESQHCSGGTNFEMEFPASKENAPSGDITSELLQQAHMASEIEELKQKVAELTEAKTQLETRNQKLADESAYAKGLASAAGVELKALSEEVTKLMNHNERLAAELASARSSVQRRVSNGPKNAKRDNHLKRHEPTPRREVNASHEREQTLEAALLEKEQREAELQKKVEESKQRETFLENELANMWVLVAKLKKSQANEPDDFDAK
ncbi:Kinesin-like protein KIN-7K, chloroplastic [Cocos nucifera]|uniref:Kinesin-like protein KIN-7K, chloroplastic n=1 Tax=Cocos nucifera TaxID=13894 RepID=A0A8K0N6E6_COCNU|nr:Kinesin-like protein KIN-7K, chloroplastic [Cocos nucifera]